MSKKRTYKSVDVEKFDVAKHLASLGTGCMVTVDVAKKAFMAGFATAAGEVLEVVRFEHPRQTRQFLSKIETLRDAKLGPRVVMEPTGTYGDALRYQVHMREVPVLMMPPKYTHDFAEIADGVPSMHDAKAVVVLAKLAAIKPLKQWEPTSNEKRDIRSLVDRRGPLSKMLSLHHGHLEAILATHWPEIYELVDLHQQRSWMALFQKYPGPEAIAVNAEDAAMTLRNASRGMLDPEKIAAIVSSASASLGMPMRKSEQEELQKVVEEIERATRKLEEVDREIAIVVSAHAEMSHVATITGAVCAATIASHVGSLLAFQSAGAVEKAMGLNLKEKSSGTMKGKLGITKRGPRQVRQLLYLAVLRLINANPIVGAWYRARSSYIGDEGSKMKAVVAVMRKLSRALFHVARGKPFDATKLFDTRRLKLDAMPVDAATLTKVPGDRTRFRPKKAPVSQVPVQDGGVA